MTTRPREEIALRGLHLFTFTHKKGLDCLAGSSARPYGSATHSALPITGMLRGGKGIAHERLLSRASSCISGAVC